MSTAQAEPPLATLEFELTEDLAYRSSVALFEMQALDVKETMIIQGVRHPILPLLAAMGILLFAIVAALTWGGVGWITVPLAILGGLVVLVLAFKTALYFCPPFARWHIRRTARRMLKRLQPPTICWTFYEDRLETKSAVSQRRLAWHDLVKIEVFPDFWCLSWPNLPLIAPLEHLTPEHQALITRLKPAEVEVITLKIGAGRA